MRARRNERDKREEGKKHIDHSPAQRSLTKPRSGVAGKRELRRRLRKYSRFPQIFFATRSLARSRDDTCGENCSPQKPQCGRRKAGEREREGERGRERERRKEVGLYLLTPEISRVTRGYLRDAGQKPRARALECVRLRRAIFTENCVLRERRGEADGGSRCAPGKGRIMAD